MAEADTSFNAYSATRTLASGAVMQGVAPTESYQPCSKTPAFDARTLWYGCFSRTPLCTHDKIMNQSKRNKEPAHR